MLGASPSSHAVGGDARASTEPTLPRGDDRPPEPPSGRRGPARRRTTYASPGRSPHRTQPRGTGCGHPFRRSRASTAGGRISQGVSSEPRGAATGPRGSRRGSSSRPSSWGCCSLRSSGSTRCPRAESRCHRSPGRRRRFASRSPSRGGRPPPRSSPQPILLGFAAREILLRQGLAAAARGGDDRLELTPTSVEAFRFLAKALGRVLGPSDDGPVAVGPDRAGRRELP
jgi:hypothetical protein